MQKPVKYAIQGSNMELFGTEVEHKCKETAAECEEQWKGTGQQPGLKVWRIEKFKVVPWPVEHYGEFYDGDSYIVFHTHGTAPNFAFDVHFWLGNETSQDEAGTAAYKTVELDDFHRGAPVQHREVQGYESELFSSCFPKGIRILHGGIDSGFRHVGPEQYQPRLFHVRGGFKDVRINQVALSRESLNSGDVFVLDNGLKLYQWNGTKSGGMERMKAGQFCRALDEERSGRPEVVVFDEPNGAEEFWALLGGQGPIKSAEEGDKHTSAPSRKVLFKLSDASGKLTFTEVAKGSVHKNQLDSADAFIFDSGNHVYVWVGRNANTNEKRNALGYATKYLGDHGLPLHTPITRIPEGAYNAAFNASFD